jgi:hypothetical protein
MRYWKMLVAAMLLSVAACGLVEHPEGHGPQWIQRPADDLVQKLGKPDQKVRLPPPSLTVAYLYTGGAVPGFAVCERQYYVRGTTVIGYSEHGSDPSCTRTGGRID